MSRHRTVEKSARSILRICVLLWAGGGAAGANAQALVHGGAGSERVSSSAGSDPVGPWLAAEATEAVRVHMRLSDELATQPSVRRTCDLAYSAQHLAPLLAASLQSRHAALVSQAFDGADASALEAFETLAAQADAQLIGIGLQVGSEITYSYVRYDEIADVGGVHPDAAALLRAAAGLWRNPTGWPVHVEQQTDTTGCEDPGALVEPFERLTRAWERAPECVRSLASEAAHQSVRNALLSASCYCRGPEKTIEDSTRLAGLAEGLDLGLSKAEANALSMRLRRGDVRFECLAN